MVEELLFARVITGRALFGSIATTAVMLREGGGVQYDGASAFAALTSRRTGSPGKAGRRQRVCGDRNQGVARPSLKKREGGFPPASFALNFPTGRLRLARDRLAERGLRGGEAGDRDAVGRA